MITSTMKRVRLERSQAAPSRPPPAPLMDRVVSRPFRPAACIILALTLVVSFANESGCFFIDSKQSPRTTQWNYKDQAQWRALNGECRGKAQSPIDIKQKHVIISQHLRLNFYNYDKAIRFKLANAHHTIKMNPIGSGYEHDVEQPLPVESNAHRLGLNSSSIHEIMTADEFSEQQSSSEQTQTPNGAPAGRLQPAGSLSDSRTRSENQQQTSGQTNNAVEHERPSSGGGGGGLFGFHLSKEKIPVYEGAPTIKLDWLDDDNNEYKLRDIHFHWAERRDNGSEHAIDGRRAAMEMHLVHIKHGLDKSSISFTSDSVAVIAILIESHRKSNLDFNPIVNELARINSSEHSQEVEYKSLYDLLPNNLQAFYTYSGSLTTPPCYQVVNWIVMAERLNMNAKQIEMFRNLYAPRTDNNHHEHANDDDDEASSGAHLIMPNVRSLQLLNNRTIMASFTKQGSRLESVTTYSSANSFQLTHTYQYAMLILIQSIWLNVRLLPRLTP